MSPDLITSGEWPFGAVARRQASYQRQLRLEALEDRRLLSITVNTLVDELDGSIGDDDISLRDAIAAAPTAETIDFSVTGTINLANLGHLLINKSLAIDGPGPSQLTINAFDPTPTMDNGDGSRVLNVDDGNSGNVLNVAIRGLKLTGGDVSGNGGAIRSVENLSIFNSTIRQNSAVEGGGISSDGTLSVTDTTLSGNRATDGGAI